MFWDRKSGLGRCLSLSSPHVKYGAYSLLLELLSMRPIGTIVVSCTTMAASGHWLADLFPRTAHHNQGTWSAGIRVHLTAYEFGDTQASSELIVKNRIDIVTHLQPRGLACHVKFKLRERSIVERFYAPITA